MMIDLRPNKSDDVEFVKVINRIVEGILSRTNSNELYIVGIDNWFDQKWLGFSGIGIVDFEFPVFMGRDDGALDEFRQEEVTVPPFSPGRVISQCYFRNKNDTEYVQTEPPILLHKKERMRSERNLHRRIKNISDSGVFVWYSSNTLVNERASIMTYTIKNGKIETWFAAFRKDDMWKLLHTKGINQDHLQEYMSCFAEKHN